MNPIINSSFNKKSINGSSLNATSLTFLTIVMKEMCRHQTVDDIPKHCPNKIHKLPCKICYTAKMTTINKVTLVDTSKIQTGELVHIDIAIYNVNSIRGFTPMLALVCTQTRMLSVFPTTSKRAPFRIIQFILITPMNEQHP